MKIKNAILAGLFFAAFPVAAQAQDIENYDEYQVSCETGAECNDFDVNYEQQPTTNDELSQRTRPRRTRRTSSDSKYYVGGNLGLFFPDGDGVDTSFGLGGKFGYKFTENIAAELEGLGYFGGTDADDLNYNVLGISGNGVFRYPFGSSDRSPYGFAGVGLGFGRVGFTGDLADDIDDAGGDTSDSGLLFQGKVGVGYPITDKIDILGQFRYLNISFDADDFDTDADGFTLDFGAAYNF